MDRIPTTIKKSIGTIRKFFFECKWFEICDFIEFTSQMLLDSRRPKFVKLCNEVLEREMSGFRLFDNKIVPITSTDELDSLEDSLAATASNIGANKHLRRALEFLNDRQSPDYRNSVKEFISAVEDVVQTITGHQRATLGETLKSISPSINPALNRGLSALYGYTSDSSGIRHALQDEPNLDFVDAKFMLVACSAFVNYLTDKAASVVKTNI